MRAAYDGIYFDLRSSIVQGSYQYKDFLPSESTLVKRYGCAHNTVRKAISILAEEGFVLPIHGKGVRVIYRSSPLVSDKRLCYEPNGMDSFHEAGRRCGFATKTKVLSMQTVEASDEFAQLTGFEPGTELVKLERVRYYNGRPLKRETNYFRASTVEGITKDDAENSVYRYIEQVRGGRIAVSKRVVSVERADEEDMRQLDMGSYDFVAVLTVAAYDNEGILCETTIEHHHPSIFSYSSTAIRNIINSSQQSATPL